MKKIIAGAISALLVAGGLTLSAVLPASATEECVPQEAVDAWTEVVPDIEHEAVYETIHHEAVYEHVEAEYLVEYHFAKFTRERTKEKVRGQWGDWSEWGAWTKWSPETHTSWETSTDPIGSPQFHAEGGNGNHKWERQWQAQWDGTERRTETAAAYDKLITPAYDEEVLVSEAWTEVVPDIEHEAIPAVECPVIPEKPEPLVDVRFASSLDCEQGIVTTATEGRTTGEPTYDPQTNTWVTGEWSEWAVIDIKERAATEEECPVVEPPVKPEPEEPVTPPAPEKPKPVPAKVSTPATLAQTGTYGAIEPNVVWIGAGALGLGLALVLAVGVRNVRIKRKATR